MLSARRILPEVAVLAAALVALVVMALAAPQADAATPTQAPTQAPAAPAPAAPAPASPTPCAVTAKACMDLSARTAWLTDGAGHIVYGPVSARGGKKGAATPTGTFSVQWKDADHYSKQFDAPMNNSVFFYPGDAFHEGSPKTASNGCIHLSAASAKKFFDTLKVGDQVQVVP